MPSPARSIALDAPGLSLAELIARQPEIPAEAIEHGEVFTRRWIVDLILDLIGYTADRDLASMRALEPACGHGAFLVPMAERLAASMAKHGRGLSEAADALRAFDLLEGNVDAARGQLAHTLVTFGHDREQAQRFAEKSVSQQDFLLRDRERQSVDFVVGNPPYIRLEEIPESRSAVYRSVCPTMGGRADIYVGFIEVGLDSLALGGALGFIVADRWMHNSYGAPLRRFVADEFSVDVTIQMHDVDAFEEQVSAYPAVSVIRRVEQGKSIVADTTKEFGDASAVLLSKWATQKRGRRRTKVGPGFKADVLPSWFDGSSLWPSGSPEVFRLMEELEERFHPIDDPATSTKVSIGIATGADEVYVTKDAQAAEPERMLPLSMASDTNSGSLEWSKHYLVNPWGEDGLVDLEDWPRLRAYFEGREAVTRRRKIAQKNPRTWYRTIDGVTRGLAEKPKLLFPDMRMTSRPVYDPGGLYPHHNLYYVISEGWDLKVLGGLLFSRIAEATIEAYCVKMRGGTLRFQAQYLRKIRLPRPDDISPAQARALAQAFEERDPIAATHISMDVYQLESPTDFLLR